MIRCADLAIAQADIHQRLGEPDFDFEAAGQPIPRPSGRPMYREQYSRPNDVRGGARATKSRSWMRLWQYRDDIRLACLRKYPNIVRSGPVDRPVVCVMDFHLERPKKYPTRLVPCGKPDVKNLMYSAEDGLSPPSKKQRLPYLWRGLWKDDSLCHTLPFRWHCAGGEERTRIRVWIMEDG